MVPAVSEETREYPAIFDGYGQKTHGRNYWECSIATQCEPQSREPPHRGRLPLKL